MSRPNSASTPFRHRRANYLSTLISGGRPTSFGAAYGVEPSTVITSRKAYFTAATGTAYTVPADTEITFDDSTWLSVNGTTPAGAKWWRCRFESSAEYETAVTKTPTLGGENYPFVVTTMAEAVEGFPFTFPFELG